MRPESLAWSPDGRQIAFSSGPKKRREISLLDLSMGVVTDLTNDSADDYTPIWSR